MLKQAIKTSKRATKRTGTKTDKNSSVVLKTHISADKQHLKAIISSHEIEIYHQ